MYTGVLSYLCCFEGAVVTGNLAGIFNGLSIAGGKAPGCRVNGEGTGSKILHTTRVSNSSRRSIVSSWAHHAPPGSCRLSNILITSKYSSAPKAAAVAAPVHLSAVGLLQSSEPSVYTGCASANDGDRFDSSCRRHYSSIPHSLEFFLFC